MTIIGFDFSINKPAACVFHNSEYHFFIWPYELKDSIRDKFSEAGVNVILRDDNKDKGNTLSSKMNYEVKNARYLAHLITSTISPFISKNTYIAFEGLSYGSKGDVGIQLGGYKYLLMDRLEAYVPLENMYTYSPITIKSAAECAKKGMTKKDMINKFITNGPNCKLRFTLLKTPEKLQTPKAKNWVENVDDLIDAFWTLETLRVKEKI